MSNQCVIFHNHYVNKSNIIFKTRNLFVKLCNPIISYSNAYVKLRYNKIIFFVKIYVCNQCIKMSNQRVIFRNLYVNKSNIIFKTRNLFVKSRNLILSYSNAYVKLRNNKIIFLSKFMYV